MLPKNLRTLWVETSPDKVLARMRRHLEKGKVDAAISVLQDALEAGGHEPILRAELSHILIAHGRAREAVEAYKALLKSDPEAHRQLAELTEWGRANQHDCQPAYELLAEHYVGKKEFGSAFAALERIDKAALKSMLGARMGRLQRAMGDGSKPLPRTALSLIYFTALLHEAMGEDGEAVETYRKIIDAYPAELRTQEQRLKGILARHYRSASLRAALAQIYLKAGEEEKAIEEYVQMFEMDPRSRDQAVKALQDLSEISSTPGDPLWGVARITGSSGGGDEFVRAAGAIISSGTHLDELAALLEQMAATTKPDPRLKILIGEASLKLGKPKKAVSSFSSAASDQRPAVRALARESLVKMLESEPENSDLLTALAELSHRDEETEAALGYLERLGRLPGCAEQTVSRLQSILISQPGNAQAEALLERMATSLDDPSLAVPFLRRRLRQGINEAKLALEDLSRVLVKHPEDYETRLAIAEAKTMAGDVKGAWELLKDLLNEDSALDPTLLHLLVLVGSSADAAFSHEVAQYFSLTSRKLASSPEGQFAIGEMAARSGDLARAVEAFRTAASFSSASAQETVAAVQALCPPEKSGHAAVALADLLAGMGDYAGVRAALSAPSASGNVSKDLLDKLQNAFRENPDDVDLRVAVSAALAAGGNPAHARRLIEDGIRKAGQQAPAPLHIAAGDAWVRESNLTEAVRSYARALSQDRGSAGETVGKLELVLDKDVGHAGAHLALGRARLLDGQSREGVNALLTAWSIKPALGPTILKDLAYAAQAFPLEPHVDLARGQILLGQGEVDAASEALGAAMQTSPDVSAEVLVRLKAMIRSHPSCANAQFHAARAWHLSGRSSDASKAYLAAAELSPALVEKSLIGLGELIQKHSGEPEPHVARAKLEELRGNTVTAATAYREALKCSAPPERTLEDLRRLASKEGPNQGHALLALAGANRELGQPDRAALALEQAATCLPEKLGEIREEAAALRADFPDTANVVLTTARLALAGLDAAAALEDAENALRMDSSAWTAVADLSFQAAEAGGDATRAVLLRSRALEAGCDFAGAAEILDEWMPRIDGDMRAELCLVRSKIERKRGDIEAARSWMAEAATLAGDREAFLSAIHEETLRSTEALVQRDSTMSDLWRGLWAALNLGNADRAEQIASLLGLKPGERIDMDPGDRQASHEALALIASHRGQNGAAADLMMDAPPSRRKAHFMERAGRLEEAAACLEELASAGAETEDRVIRLYCRMAAERIAGEPGCLEAETHLDFSTRQG